MSLWALAFRVRISLVSVWIPTQTIQQNKLHSLSFSLKQRMTHYSIIADFFTFLTNILNITVDQSQSLKKEKFKSDFSFEHNDFHPLSVPWHLWPAPCACGWKIFLRQTHFLKTAWWILFRIVFECVAGFFFVIRCINKLTFNPSYIADVPVSLNFNGTPPTGVVLMTESLFRLTPLASW